MLRKFIQLFACVWLISFASSVTVQAYTFLFDPPSVWPNGNVPMVLKLGSVGRTLIDGNTSWDTVAAQALTNWNGYIGTMQFTSSVQSPGVGSGGDRVNQVFFNSTVHGQSFGTALAVTRSWYVGTNNVEADVVFNTAYSWDSYRGSWRFVNGQLLCDFRRVALHEFGHALGLDHPDGAGQNVMAMMNGQTGDLDNLTPDDISGAQELYPQQPGFLTITVLADPLKAGTVNGGGAFPSGSTRNVTAIANTNYRFISWTEKGNVVSTSASYTFALTASRNLVANFATNMLTLTINSQNGSVTRTPNQSSYAPGAWVVLKAMPNANYQFAGWSGDAIGSTNPLVVTMNSNKTITANFARVNYVITLSASPSYGGTTSGGGTSASGSTRTVTAKVNSGYTFTNWTENIGTSFSYIVSTSSNYTFNVTGNRTLVANFAGKIPSIFIQPQSQSVVVGANASFFVMAASTIRPLKYQWRKNGNPISGATAGYYSISAAQLSNAGSYSVIVSNLAGSVTSSSALLSLKLLLASTAVGNGSVTPSPNILVNPGNTQTFTATPLTNYTVGEWQLDGIRKQTGGTSYKLSNVQTNHTVKVVFRPIIKLYFQNTNGSNIEWRFNGTNYLATVWLPSIGSAWKMVGQSDFNYDGQTDLLFQNIDGRLLVRTLNGTSTVRDNLVRNGQAVPAGWKVKALSELGGDGYVDFLFQSSTNRLAAWLMNKGTNFLSSPLMQSHNSGWRVAGMADFNGDTKKDILWQNSSGNVSVWFMNGRTNIGSRTLFSNQPFAAGWNISALADMDYNGQKDILLQNSKGQVAAWLMNRTNYLRTVLLRNGQTNTPGWQVVGPK